MQVREILQEEEDLSEIVQLVGKVGVASFMLSTFDNRTAAGGCQGQTSIMRAILMTNVGVWFLRRDRQTPCSGVSEHSPSCQMVSTNFNMQDGLSRHMSMKKNVFQNEHKLAP